MILPSESALFASDSDQHFMVFSGIAFGFNFSHFSRIYHKTNDFDTTLEARWAQNGTQKPPRAGSAPGVLGLELHCALILHCTLSLHAFCLNALFLCIAFLLNGIHYGRHYDSNGVSVLLLFFQLCSLSFFDACLMDFLLIFTSCFDVFSIIVHTFLQTS